MGQSVSFFKYCLAIEFRTDNVFGFTVQCAGILHTLNSEELHFLKLLQYVVIQVSSTFNQSPSLVYKLSEQNAKWIVSFIFTFVIDAHLNLNLYFPVLNLAEKVK